MERRPERISSLNVERGLYVLRYIGGSSVDHPVIFVRPSPGSEDLVRIVPFPGDPRGKLSYPGALMVIAADESAMLQLTAQASTPGGSVNAEVRVDPLVPSVAGLSTPAVAATPIERPAQRTPAAVTSEFASRRLEASAVAVGARVETAPVPGEGKLNVLAHVSRRGDVVSRDGVWVGGPDAPAPIEGLALDCPRAIGTLQYQVLAAGENRWSDWLSSGEFGGSRGRAKPLTGVRIRLTPAVEGSVFLDGEALFLGSAIIRKDGLELEFRSAAGLDPLVGIRLDIARNQPVPAPRPGIVSTVPQNGRVRVFKASSRRSG